MEKPQRQMLALSVHDEEKSIPYIFFEIGDYFRDQHRRIHNEYEIYFDEDMFSYDDEFLYNLGYSLVLGLLIPNIKDHGRARAQFVYPYFRGNNPVVRIDEETYVPKSCRQFCKKMELKTTDAAILTADRNFCQAVANTVLTYLPISEELCMTKEGVEF